VITDEKEAVAGVFPSPRPFRRFRLLMTCAWRRTGSHVAPACSGPAPLAHRSRLAQRGSTASLVPRALTLPRRAPPPLWETTRAATRTVTGSTNQEGLSVLILSAAWSRSDRRGWKPRPRAWSLARSRSRGARLRPSGRLRAPRTRQRPGGRGGTCAQRFAPGLGF